MIPIHNNIVSDAVADFIVTDMQNPDIVEGQGFQRLIAVLRLVVDIITQNLRFPSLKPDSTQKI